MKTELFKVDFNDEIKTNNDIDKFFSYARTGKYEDLNLIFRKS